MISYIIILIFFIVIFYLYKSYQLVTLYNKINRLINEITDNRINFVKKLIKYNMSRTYEEDIIQSIHNELVLFLYVNLFSDRVHSDIEKYVKKDDNFLNIFIFDYKKSYNDLINIIAYNIYLTNNIDKLITINNFVEYINRTLHNKPIIKKLRSLQILIALSHTNIHSIEDKIKFNKIIDKLEKEIFNEKDNR